MNNETWLPVNGFEGSYQVSSSGQVRSLDRISINNGNQARLKGKVHKSYVGKLGYTVTSLSNLQGKKLYFVHRLVAIAFIPNPENKPQVNHLDGCKTNNNIANLEWVTSAENLAHAQRTGLGVAPEGIKHWNAKLTPELIQQAKELRTLGHTYKEIGLIVGVNYQTISEAINGKQWKHLS